MVKWMNIQRLPEVSIQPSVVQGVDINRQDQVEENTERALFLSGLCC